jgi:hypothetical protein
MKPPLSKLSSEKAQKELKQFLIIGYICAVIALFTLGLLSMVGMAFGARCVLLVNHEGNRTNPKLKQLKIASVLLLVLSVVEFALYLAQAS